MNKKVLFAVFAVVPLAMFSCSKEAAVVNSEEPQERSTIIDPWTEIDQSDYVKIIPGEPSTIQAGFSDTKSHLSMNGTGTYAKVVWDIADEFQLFGYSDGWSRADYTATEAGDKVFFSTPHVKPSAATLHGIYAPLSDKGSGKHVSVPSNNPASGFGLNLPSAQTAVADGIVNGLNYSYAQCENTSEDLSFHNILALVRFKMTGAIASSITSVTLTGASAIAGDFVLAYSDDGTPIPTFTKNFKGDVSSPSVTLSGTLAPDTYYYFAVVPTTQNSFSICFSGATGSTTKIATKTVTFPRGEISDLGTIDLGDAFTDTNDNSTIQFMTASAGAPKPVTIAVIPDGFTQGEMRNYEMLAKAAINTLFNVEPFKTYKNYFNVYIFRVPSNESGARISDGTDEEKNRDCYFKSEWGKTDYSNMRADDDLVFDYVTENCPDIVNGIHSILSVPVLMIINDTRYGGVNWTYSDGKAYCMAPYSYAGGRLSWSYPSKEAVSDSDPSAGYQDTPEERFNEVGSNVGNWMNTMVHEFGGHCFSRLDDEYWNGTTDKGYAAHIKGYTYTVKFGLNVSATYENPGKDDTYGQAGWQFLLDKKADLVASNPLYNRIGVYQGGGVSILNRWRSERISCMIDNRFYFSTFQRWLIVKRIMTLAGAAFNEDDFWANDVATDPVRDIITSPVMGDEQIPPRLVPMLPPPRFVVVD